MNGLEIFRDVYYERLDKLFWKEYLDNADYTQILNNRIELYENALSSDKSSSEVEGLEELAKEVGIEYWNADYFKIHRVDFVPRTDLKGIELQAYALAGQLAWAIRKHLPYLLDFRTLKNYKCLEEEEDPDDLIRWAQKMKEYETNNSYVTDTLVKLESDRKLHSEWTFEELEEDFSKLVDKLTQDDKKLLLDTEEKEFGRLFKSGEKYNGWEYLQDRTNWSKEKIDLLYSVYRDVILRKAASIRYGEEKNRAFGEMLGIQKYLNFLRSKSSSTEKKLPVEQLPYFQLKSRSRDLIPEIYGLLLKYDFIRASSESFNALTSFFSKSIVVKKIIWKRNIAELREFINILLPHSEVSRNNKWPITSLYFLSADGNELSRDSLRSAKTNTIAKNFSDFEAELVSVLGKYNSIEKKK